MTSNLSIEKAAAEFREKWGYNTTNPIRVKSLLIQMNILTIFKRMDASFSGMSLRIDDDKFMLINSSHSIGRQHFTIFHELYHLFIQKDFDHVFCNDVVDKKKLKEEENADIFASNLMLPKDGLLKQIPETELKKDKITINSILLLEQYYSCSHKAMLNRLEDLQLISEKNKEKLAPDVKLLAQQYGYDTKLYDSGNDNLIIGDYGAKAKKLFDDNIISKAHYLSLMQELGIEFGIKNIDGNEQ